MESHKNIYELRFEHSIAKGLPIADAAIAVAEAYLDGKPARRGKHPFRAADKNAAFWSCQFLETLSADLYETEPFVLALARYMGQQQTANFELVRRIAQVAPEAVRRAVRYSGLVLRQNSERWKEVERLATTEKLEFSEFIRVCHRFDHAHRDRVAEVEVNRKLLDDLTPLELLSYASLYAFEHMVPDAFNQISKGSDTNIDSQEIWDAINDILVWKLQTCAGEAFRLTDAIISGSLRVHLSPLLFPSRDSLMFREDIHLAFGYLVSAHLELNSFLSRSVDAFCYDDSIRFEFAGADLVIVELDPNARSAWIRNGKKLARLHGYWYYRAMNEFISSGMATERIGRPENHEKNRIAYIKAIRTKLQLSEVYGLGNLVLADTGLQVDLFQALLSLELMTAFCINDFILPYGEHLKNTGHWRSALTCLAIGGLLQSESQNQFHNRFPLTWSDRAVKIESIRPWTVSNDFPHGNAKTAEAILDFWTSDLGALSAQLRGGGPTMIPDLFERPVLKMGRYLFELPWMLAMQNNASAAINNLRRIGARRTGTKGETQRIENRLATLFKERGFHVCLNYQPEKTIESDPGEVDIICARDGQLLVLEIKSTFLRRSVKDSWLHKTTTLRKAGLQLRRKVEAVKAELASDAKLALSLGIEQEDGMPLVRGWIVDTCIEHDHEFFSGFLKVSLEEVLIALRDDRHLLNDPHGWLTGRVVDVNDDAFLKAQVTSRLYPDGFSGGHFIDVILRQTVWATSSEHG